MAQVKVTLVYPYGGDFDTNEEAIAEEKKALENAEVDIRDILAAGGATLTVEIIGDVGDEDVEDEDEDDEKAA